MCDGYKLSELRIFKHTRAISHCKTQSEVTSDSPTIWSFPTKAVITHLPKYLEGKSAWKTHTPPKLLITHKHTGIILFIYWFGRRTQTLRSKKYLSTKELWLKLYTICFRRLCLLCSFRFDFRFLCINLIK